MTAVRPNDSHEPSRHGGSAPASAPAADMTGAGGSWLTRPMAVLALVLVWALTHLLLRGLSSSVIGTDDMMENVFLQTLEAGYSLRQPPLYEWLLWPLQQLTGPTIWSFLILKYGLVLAACACLLALARLAMPPLTAAFCVLSFSALYQFGWNLHEGVTHTLVLVLACAATTLALVRALLRGGTAAYLLLGLAIGAGLLSKHSFLLFAAALALAVISDRFWRSRLSAKGLALSACVAALCYAPYLFWLLDQPRGLVGASTAVLVTGEATSHAARSALGLARLGWSLFGFSMPFLVLVLALFWRDVAPGRPEAGDPLSDRAAVARLCGRTVLLAITIAAGAILVSGATYVKERHMHPVLLLLPVWLFARIGVSEPQRFRRLGMVLLALAVLAFLIRVPGLVAPERAFCGGVCRHMKPYDALVPELAELGADRATLIGDDDYTAGNLRALFPGARIVGPSWRPPTPPREVCLLVWEAGDGALSLASSDVFARFPKVSVRDLASTPRAIAAGWPHPWKDDGHRVTTFGVAELLPSSSFCH